jgi:hypothetical protein
MADQESTILGLPLSPSRVLRRTEHLRWRVPPGTTTAPPVLEQAWLDVASGAVEWMPVPTVVEEAPANAR